MKAFNLTKIFYLFVFIFLIFSCYFTHLRPIFRTIITFIKTHFSIISACCQYCPCYVPFYSPRLNQQIAKLHYILHNEFKTKGKKPQMNVALCEQPLRTICLLQKKVSKFLQFYLKSGRYVNGQ